MANLQTFERTEYQQVKADLHRKILDRLDLEKLGRTPSDAAREEVSAADPEHGEQRGGAPELRRARASCPAKFWMRSSAWVRSSRC